VRWLRHPFEDTHNFESFLLAKDGSLVPVVEDSHWSIRFFLKEVPVNFSPASVGFFGFRSRPTCIVILRFIHHQGIKSRFKAGIARDLSHQTRNDFAEVKFTFLRGGWFIPSDTCIMQQFTSQLFPVPNCYPAFLALSLRDQRRQLIGERDVLAKEQDLQALVCEAKSLFES
jgi:hypothetical protein